MQENQANFLSILQIVVTIETIIEYYLIFTEMPFLNFRSLLGLHPNSLHQLVSYQSDESFIRLPTYVHVHCQLIVQLSVRIL
jgi:hypothetical protein